MSRVAFWRRASAAEKLAHRAESVRRRRWLWPLVTVLVVAAVAGAVWLAYFSQVLAVRQVKVVGAQTADIVAIRRLGEQQLDRPLARVDTGRVSAQVEEVPAISRAAVDRVFPRTLRITVTTREPVLAVRNAQGDVEVMDAAGVVFRHPKEAPKDVPLVQSTVGQIGPEGVAAALSVLNDLPPSLRSRVSGVTVGEADSVSFKVGPTTVQWGAVERPELKAKVVEALLRTKPRPAEIDVSAPDTPVTRGSGDPSASPAG